jgi:hypothetical protein
MKTTQNKLDLLTEDTLTLQEACKELPGNPHVSTLWRWKQRGVGGVKLETVRIGTKHFTSRQALTRFLKATQ